MKTIAYTALLYGKDYLYYAIKSVIDYVDEYHVIYDVTGHGSHGHWTERECPDKRWELINQATNAAGDKLRWHDAGPFPHEGAQREAIHQYAPDADVILVLDADEIWPARTAALVREAPIGFGIEPCHSVRLPIVHFWRSFYRAILHDPAFPTRIIYPKVAGGECTVGFTNIGGSSAIAHMGYAQRSEIVEYKQHTHGHKGEWRKDDWFNTVFMANAQMNCHPVGSEYWNPEQVNPWDYMPEFMKTHPYAGLELIP